MANIFFNNWESLLRTSVLAVCAYATLVVLVRISGKRTLSKMNAFDFLVTVALGSTLATVVLNKETSFVQGVVAFSVLIGCQFLVTWLSVRSQWVYRAVTGEPQILLYKGQFVSSAMRATRTTENDVFAAARSAGILDWSTLHAVVLETDSSLSVIGSAANPARSTLKHVKGAPRG